MAEIDRVKAENVWLRARYLALMTEGQRLARELGDAMLAQKELAELKDNLTNHTDLPAAPSPEPLPPEPELPPVAEEPAA